MANLGMSAEIPRNRHLLGAELGLGAGSDISGPFPISSDLQMILKIAYVRGPPAGRFYGDEAMSVANFRISARIARIFHMLWAIGWSRTSRSHVEYRMISRES